MTAVLETGGGGAVEARHEEAGEAAAGGAGQVPGGHPQARRGVVSRVSALIDRARDAVGVLYREMMKFGVVGAVAFVVDIGLFNLLSTNLWPGSGPAPLDGHEKIAKTISVTVATLVAWFGNRQWSFRHRRQAAAHRELVLFAVMNVGGLLIAVTCLTISHDMLGFTSPLADNISGNLIGIGLGTLFRFWAYRRFVFTEFRNPQIYDQTSSGMTDDVAGQRAGRSADPAATGASATGASAMGAAATPLPRPDSPAA